MICKRIELEIIELRIGEFHDAGDITARRLDFLLLASELRINQYIIGKEIVKILNGR